MTSCAHRACVRPVRAYGVCRVHLDQALAAGRRATAWTPAIGRLDALIHARYGLPHERRTAA